MTATSEQLKFPIGKFVKPDGLTEAQRATLIEELAKVPAKLKKATAGLNDEQLDTPYRPDGWTVRQVVHHLADASINQYTRFKLALTEDNPTIKPFEEDPWASFADSKLPIASSIALLDGLFDRWMALLRAMSAEDFARTLVHPASSRMDLNLLLPFCVWHGKHHIAHITSLRERMGW
ncbi:YfiT family bacillithiol transferase [Cohnella panacarvi]|uniref:YfiT family bacillithiol transferase n=1 Tax=Cohnella panacarvi TaxID=400776 RepID=UPI00047D8C56|nr:putative metal-dependent hydrolase [Cohnella panacarvi]